MTTADIAKEQQDQAIRHAGSPARLLAGPGTGKTWTLTERVIYLINTHGIPATEILALTFTRAAAQELRGRVRRAIGDDAVAPRVMTLHSYALRQLLRNSKRYQNLPQPLRIIDDWEERFIVQEDLKQAMAKRTGKPFKVADVRQLLRNLASDWESLRADNSDWEKSFPNPDFIGAWHRHRTIYGYTLRSELVYQLKQALFLHGDFELDGIPKHLLIDEFQDLNPCDLAVVHWMRDQGAELFAAGDDDQSIYGFRNAYPFGIRRFIDEVKRSRDLRLEICQRCDTSILRLADFVIRLDTNRVSKDVRPMDSAGSGEVKLARFPNQYYEAQAIAGKARALTDSGIAPADILILIRQDRYGAFSSVLADALKSQGVPVNVDVAPTGMFSVKASEGERQLLALLRLAGEGNDSIAWRTLFIVDKNGLGKSAQEMVEEFAASRLSTFAKVLLANLEEPLFGSSSARIAQYVRGVLADVQAIEIHLDTSKLAPEEKASFLKNKLTDLPKPGRIESQDKFSLGLKQLSAAASESDAFDLTGLLVELGAVKADEEQVIDPDAVNILTMHKAKGLGADTVFIACAEDEYIPGEPQNLAELDDARRLLYVSLTRARHRLYITYCDTREGRQSYSRVTAGDSSRSLTRFLMDAGLKPVSL